MNENKERNLILLGAAGAGKGTQSQKMATRLNIPQISTGDMLRQARRDQTPLGKSADGYMTRGELVPDELVIGLVEERLQKPDAGPGFILDGFPRTLEQARALDTLLKKLGRAPLQVVDVQVPEALLVERLSGRLSCPKDGASYHLKFAPPKTPGHCDRCQGALTERADDKPDAVKQRLVEYRNKTAPLIDYYHQQRLLHPVDGVGEVEAVFSRITQALQLS